MFTYIEELQALVCCDAFGAHYAHDGVLLSTVKDDEGYQKAFDYYYAKIMGPFPKFCQMAAAKVLKLPLKLVCPGHGPVLDTRIKERVSRYLELPNEVSPEAKPHVVTVVYCSAYGYTKKLALSIAEKLKGAGKDVRLFEIDALNYAKDKDKIIHSIYESSFILLGSPTLAGDAVGLFYDLLSSLPTTVGNGRKAGAFGDYGWSGEATNNLTVRLGQLHFQTIAPFRCNFAMDEATQAKFEEYLNDLVA